MNKLCYCDNIKNPCKDTKSFSHTQAREHFLFYFLAFCFCFYEKIRQKQYIYIVYILYKCKKCVYLQKRGCYLMAILWESYGYHMVRIGKGLVNGYRTACFCPLLHMCNFCSTVGTPLPLRGGFPPKLHSHFRANYNLFSKQSTLKRA